MINLFILPLEGVSETSDIPEPNIIVYDIIKKNLRVGRLTIANIWTNSRGVARTTFWGAQYLQSEASRVLLEPIF